MGSLHMERQLKGPFFTQEPPSRVDFLNEIGARIICRADGYPKPQIHWQGSDNKIVTNVENFRTVLINSTLILLPFKPAAYRQDIHSASMRCVASNAVGAIRSRDIQVRAGKTLFFGIFPFIIFSFIVFANSGYELESLVRCSVM
ncbi:Down syndrome cell adhesion molecule-like protein Dscam2 [Orchesella cincta]|uniref:Down syndrome cell adhesion molecule-like protein Dscam2 n=1 Tax=Orchesella cincta TaxID=48709 RepID=A0A1D2N8W9_ORCCI|nr:Down syndrome cell adhesion molecule-like protein Dscam2 [Orchesella cincta]